MARRYGTCLLALLAWLLLSPAAHAQDPPADAFVQVQDGQFVLDGAPYYFAGTNLWYGMNLGADLQEGDRERLIRELDLLEARGITNLRVLAGSEGPAGEPWRVHPAVQNAPGDYDERLLRGLDVLLAEMGKRDMKAVLVLNNFFQWSGGMAQYYAWASGTDIPYPMQDGNTWDEFQHYATRFYESPEARQLFLDYLDALVHRTNTVTHAPYRDDPTIMAWQLANEPRGFARTELYIDWIEEAAGFLQRNAPNHLVSLGGEGKIEPVSGTAFERVSRLPMLDYLTAHIWIENWGWFDPQQPDTTFPVAIGRAMGYLADHVSIAHDVNKPLVVEEFGVSRDLGDYAPEAPTEYRDTYYRIVLEALHKLAQEGNVAAGSNVWGWSGEAKPVEPEAFWEPGQPLTGDPPHERQGWYGIYADDASTLGVLSHYARLMNALGAPSDQGGGQN